MIVPTYVAALMVTLVVASTLWWYAKTVVQDLLMINKVLLCLALPLQTMDILFEYPFTNRKANAQQGGILDIMTG